MRPNTLKINNFTSGQTIFQKKPTRVVGFFEVNEQDQDSEPLCPDFDSQDSCFRPPIAKPLTIEPESRPGPPKDSYQSDLDWNISQIQLESQRASAIMKRELIYELKSIVSSACTNLNKMVNLRPKNSRMTLIEIKSISMTEFLSAVNQKKSESSIGNYPIKNKHTIDFTYSIAETQPQMRRIEKKIQDSNSIQG